MEVNLDANLFFWIQYSVGLELEPKKSFSFFFAKPYFSKLQSNHKVSQFPAPTKKEYEIGAAAEAKDQTFQSLKFT